MRGVWLDLNQKVSLAGKEKVHCIFILTHCFFFLGDNQELEVRLQSSERRVEELLGSSEINDPRPAISDWFCVFIFLCSFR